MSRTINVEPGIAGDLADHPPLLRSAQRPLRRHARCARQPCRAPRRLALHRHRRRSLRDGRADARRLRAATCCARTMSSIERRPKRELSADAVSDVGAAIGMAVRQPIRAGQMPAPRRPDEAGTRSRATSRSRSSSRRPASRSPCAAPRSEPGTEGDIINVINIQSKRQIQGVVTGPGQVTVSTGTAAYHRESRVRHPSPAARAAARSREFK